MSLEPAIPCAPKSVTLPIATVQDCQIVERVGPWKLKRAYTDSSLSTRVTETVVEEQVSLKEFLTKVDEDCKLIEKLAIRAHGDTRKPVASRNLEPEQLKGVQKDLTEIPNRPFWNHCSTSSHRIEFHLMLTAVVSMVAPVAHLFGFAYLKGTRMILPTQTSSKATAADLIAATAISSAPVMIFAWVSVYLFFAGSKPSYTRTIVNVMLSLLVADSFTYWTLFLFTPMLS